MFKKTPAYSPAADTAIQPPIINSALESSATTAAVPSPAVIRFLPNTTVPLTNTAAGP